jgi:hypothetical protein
VVSETHGRAAHRIPTKALLICGGFAAIQVLAFLVVVPFTTAAAVAAPPLYAVVAGVHSLMPFLARLVTGMQGTALITATVTALIVSAVTALGPLIILPMAVAGALFDVVLWRAGRDGRLPRAGWTIGAAAAAGVGLFLVSLPVFSAEHLTAWTLVLTLAGRLAGEIGAALFAWAIARRLALTGVTRGFRG